MVSSLHLETLGSAPLASALSYLGDGFAFVGSQYGDSSLVRILDEPVPVCAAGGGGGGGGGKDERGDDDDDDVMGGTQTTYLSTVEEYTNLGPIVDFDTIPTAHSTASEVGSGGSGGGLQQHRQSMVVTASGVGSAGSIRLIRSGIGLTESASIHLPGIKGMWNLRQKFGDVGDDKFMVQSYVGETRVLGVLSEEEEYKDEDEDEDEDEEQDDSRMEEDSASEGMSQSSGSQDDDEGVGATLAEVLIPGFDSKHSTLYAGNVFPFADNAHVALGDAAETLAVQVTESEVRLVDLAGVPFSTDAEPTGPTGDNNASLLDVYRPESGITVAAGNEAGQIVLALRGGSLVYLSVIAGDQGGFKIESIGTAILEREISCLDVRPFDVMKTVEYAVEETTSATAKAALTRSSLVAVGLWDDFTVRMLSLDHSQGQTSVLAEVLRINLGSEHQLSSPTSDMDMEDRMDKVSSSSGGNSREQHMMARSLCMVTLGSEGHYQSDGSIRNARHHQSGGVDVLLVGLGDGGLLSFVVSSVHSTVGSGNKSYSVYSRKEVSLGSRAVGLVPFRAMTLRGPSEANDNRTGGDHAVVNGGGGTCVLATGDRPTVVYLAGGNGTVPSGNGAVIPKLCYSAVHLTSDTTAAGGFDNTGEEEPSGAATGGRGREALTVAVAAPFHSNLLFSSSTNPEAAHADSPDPAGTASSKQGASVTYPLCIADESILRLGTIADSAGDKLHVTKHNIGMTPRRVAYHEAGRTICVGAIDEGLAANTGTAVTNTTGGDRMMTSEFNMGNCVRFYDDISLDEIDRLDLDPFEMILSMISVTLRLNDSAFATTDGISGEGDLGDDEKASKRRPVYRPYVLIGTAYAYPDEDEPTRGRVLLVQCGGGGDSTAMGQDSSMVEVGSQVRGSFPSSLNRAVRVVTEMQTKGAVYSMCPFYDNSVLITVNCKTRVCRLFNSGDSGSFIPELRFVGYGHEGHVLSICVQSLVPPHAASSSLTPGEMDRSRLAIVGDLMRSVSVVQYYPNYESLEEVARDYNSNWTTAVEMLNEDTYLVGENWMNFVVLKRNPHAQSEEVRCRLDTVGMFNYGEMPNKFLRGSLVVPTGSAAFSGGGDVFGASALSSGQSSLGRSPKKAKKAAAAAAAAGSGGGSPMKAVVTVGSQTLFVTVDGSVGAVLGLDAPSAAFFSSLERCMARAIRPVGGLGHSEFRAFVAEQRHHPSRGFIDGDLIESFLDLDRRTMERVVAELNEDGRWEIEDFDDAAKCISSGGDGVDENSMIDKNTILTIEDVIGMVEEISMSH